VRGFAGRVRYPSPVVVALVAGEVDHAVVTSSPLPPRGGESAPARGYLLDNARAEAGERFVWLAEMLDGVTRGHFDRLGARAGPRCREAGAGGPGIPQAPAAAAGPAGRVPATDTNPSRLKADGGHEARRHDIAADPPPEPGTLDPAHARRTPGSRRPACPTGLGRRPRWRRRRAEHPQALG
jgi:hypothetical protein